MKTLQKFAYLVLAISLFSLTSFAQDQNTKSLKKLNEFNTWTLQMNVGINYAHADLAYNDLFYKNVYSNSSAGLRVTKYLFPHFALATDFSKTNLHGYNKEYSYSTKINYQLCVLAQFQTGYPKYIENFKNFQLYGYVGYGLLDYNSKLISQKTGEEEAHYSDYTQVMPVGLGIKYKTNKDIVISFEYVFNNINTDYLDAFNNPLTNFDDYSKFQLGFSFMFTNKNKERLNLEWLEL